MTTSSDLRFRDLQLRLQTRRIDDAREVRSRADALSDLNRHFLQHAREPGANLQARRLLPSQGGHRLAPLHFRLLHGELYRERLFAVGETLLFHLLPLGRRLGEQLRAAKLNRRYEPVLRHLLVGIGIHLRLRRIGRNRRGRGALGQQIAIEIGLQHFVVVLRRAQIEIGGQRRLLRLGIGSTRPEPCPLRRGCQAERPRARRFPRSSP